MALDTSEPRRVHVCVGAEEMGTGTLGSGSGDGEPWLCGAQGAWLPEGVLATCASVSADTCLGVAP